MVAGGRANTRTDAWSRDCRGSRSAATTASDGSREGARGDPALASGWPELDITADSFVSKGRPLGRLELVARPSGSEWQIERLRLANDDGAIAAEGAWRGSGRAQQTKLDVALDVGDAGGLPAAAWASRTRCRERRRRSRASSRGPAHRTSFDYPTLSGTFRVDVGAGRFTKVDPGIGKLLGVLSLQALPRRITLDFRDVFSEGFAFDEINGTVRVDRGVLTTDNLKLVGPAAKVEIAGEADLAQRDAAAAR